MSQPVVSSAPLDPLVRDAVREAFALHWKSAAAVVRQFGLVAIGAKPASLRTFARDADGRLCYGLNESRWYPDEILDVLRAAGLAVLLADDEKTWIVSPTMARAERIRRLSIELCDPTTTTERMATIDLRLGALLGYPRSGSEAYNGDRQEAALSEVRSHLTIAETYFHTFVIAEHAIPEGVALIQCLSRSFAAAFGNLDPVEAQQFKPDRKRSVGPADQRVHDVDGARAVVG